MKFETRAVVLSLPPALAAEVEAVAGKEKRPASDVVREAVERYLMQSREHAPAAHASSRSAGLTATEAVERLLTQRQGNVLPDGMTTRELMTFGRA